MHNFFGSFLLSFVIIFNSAVKLIYIFFYFESLIVSLVGLFFSGSFWLFFCYHLMIIKKEPIYYFFNFQDLSKTKMDIFGQMSMNFVFLQRQVCITFLVSYHFVMRHFLVTICYHF